MGNVYHDFMMVLAGGIIGLLSSLIVLGIQYLLNHKGETKIYYKFLGLPTLNINHPGWGYTEQEDWIALWIPMAIELMNTSNVTRAVRDFDLYLYYSSKVVARMAQIEYSTGADSVKYGTDNNSYSFTLSPRSVQKQKCLFSYKICKGQEQTTLFDSIKIKYYDEKDHLHEASIYTNIDDCWKIKFYETDKNWLKLGKC